MPRMETVLAMKLLVLALWGLISIVTTVSSFEQENCRCLATNDCWPTSSKWDEFNTTVGGRLIAPKPTGYPCHDAHFDAARCESVRANSTEPHWRPTRGARNGTTGRRKGAKSATGRHPGVHGVDRVESHSSACKWRTRAMFKRQSNSPRITTSDWR